MELNLEAITTPARPAATVILLRDASAGLEVFLLKRHGLSDVLGGAYVFPGGKLDPADSDESLLRRLDETPQRLHAALGEVELATAVAAALYVAALREAFEESGVLFAQGVDEATTQRAAVLLRQGHAFDEMLGLLDLRLATQALAPWSRWITPRLASVSNKRFDTRFFVAALPAGQTASHDMHETTESVWLTPRAALQQYWSGQIQLAPPQIMSLSHLSSYGRSADVLRAARLQLPPVIEPEPFEEDGTRVICYPGDARHSVAQRALPGVLRLYYRNQRFEPEGGLAALLRDGEESMPCSL